MTIANVLISSITEKTHNAALISVRGTLIENRMNIVAKHATIKPTSAIPIRSPIRSTRVLAQRSTPYTARKSIIVPIVKVII